MLLTPENRHALEVIPNDLSGATPQNREHSQLQTQSITNTINYERHC